MCHYCQYVITHYAVTLLSASDICHASGIYIYIYIYIYIHIYIYMVMTVMVHFIGGINVIIISIVLNQTGTILDCQFMQ